MKIRWDPKKSEETRRKHHIGFDEAATAFRDPLLVATHDPEVSTEAGEERCAAIGETTRYKLIFIGYTIEEDGVRIITARHASSAQKRHYMKRGDIIRDKPPHEEEDFRPDIDWSKAVRGLHYIEPRALTVTLDPNLYLFVNDADDVNAMLWLAVKHGLFPPSRKASQLTPRSPSHPAPRALRGARRRR